MSKKKQVQTARKEWYGMGGSSQGPFPSVTDHIACPMLATDYSGRSSL